MTDNELVLKDDYATLRLQPDKYGIYFRLVVYGRDDPTEHQSISLDRVQLKAMQDWIREIKDA